MQNKIKNSNNETVKAGCVVLNDSNEILLVSKLTETVWTFPKGHCEEGESLESVATREVLEETGYKVEVVKRLSDLIYTHGKTGELIRVAMFLAKSLGSIGVGEEQTKLKWFGLDEAKKNIYVALYTVFLRYYVNIIIYLLQSGLIL